MTMRETNIALLSAIPDELQPQIHDYLKNNFLGNSPFKPLSADDVYAELAAAREYTARGEFEDFDDALDEISAKYEL